MDVSTSTPPAPCAPTDDVPARATYVTTGVIVTIFTVILIACLRGCEVGDVMKVNRKYKQLDQKCKRYLNEVASVPTWRRNGVMCLITGFLTAIFVSASDARHKTLTAGIAAGLLCFLTGQSQMGFFHWHVMCDRNCT